MPRQSGPRMALPATWLVLRVILACPLQQKRSPAGGPE